jgi:hypothetical protein
MVTFSVQFSDAKNKMAAIIGSHFVKNIRKPDRKVRFSDGRNKMASYLKSRPDICSLA